MAVTETKSDLCASGVPSRGILFLGGYVTNRNAWNIEVDGYDAGQMAAEHGIHGFSVDYFGVGESWCPQDGGSVTPLDQVPPLVEVLKYLCDLRGLSQGIDLVAESIGTGVASNLAADRKMVRSVVLTTVMYKKISDLARAFMLSDERRAELEACARGYLETDADYYAMVTGNSPPQVASWIGSTQPGRYPTGFFLRMFAELPYFDPSPALAPGLLLVGRDDMVPAQGDVESLARDFGESGASLHYIEGAGHMPRMEAPEVAARYWAEVFKFLKS